MYVPVNFCLFISILSASVIFVRSCPFLSVSVNFCPFLSLSASFCLFIFVLVRFCLFISVAVCFSLLLSLPVRLGIFVISVLLSVLVERISVSCMWDIQFDISILRPRLAKSRSSLEEDDIEGFPDKVHLYMQLHCNGCASQYRSCIVKCAGSLVSW